MLLNKGTKDYKNLSKEIWLRRQQRPESGKNNKHELEKNGEYHVEETAGAKVLRLKGNVDGVWGTDDVWNQTTKHLEGRSELVFTLWTMVNCLDFIQKSDIKSVYFCNINLATMEKGSKKMNRHEEAIAVVQVRDDSDSNKVIGKAQVVGDKWKDSWSI